jgi:serine/threonine protein kinase
MSRAFLLLKCIGKAAANFVGGGVAGDVLFEVLPDVAEGAWKWWHAEHGVEQRRQDFAEVAAATPAEIRERIASIVLEVAADKPEANRQALEIYLSLIPGEVRRSLRGPANPTGRTVTFAMLPGKAEDLLAILPGKLPRFKPGDRPLVGVDWELEELLGVGGFGEVWKARHSMLSSVEPVALKFCLDASAARYLRNEAAVLDRVMRQGRHPGIVALQHTYLSAETPCLEYEYVAGGDLAGLIADWHKGGHRPSLADVCRAFLKLARIIAHAHGQSPPIVHRDLKPANILVEVSPDGEPEFKVADFGIGGIASRQAIAEGTRGTSRGLFLATALRGSCTPLYAGPQQMRGEAPDPRDDVYSLGVVWYQMLAGDLTAGRPGGTRWQRRLEDAGLDRALVDLLGECLEDDLGDRIPDAGTLARRLDAYLSNADIKPVVVQPKITPPPRIEPERPLALLVEQRDREQQRKRAEWESQRAELQRQPMRDASAHARLGELNRFLGDHAQAVADCTEAIRLDPSLARAYSTRGSAHRMRGQLDLAVADCGEAIRLDTAAVLAYFNRGEAYRLRGDLDRAVADFTRAVELDPAYSWAHGSRGAAKQQKGDLSGAIADLDESIRLEPTYAWAYVVRAETSRLRGDFDRAIADCNDALRLQEGSCMAYATRGAAFRQKGDFGTATADLERALRLKPDYQWARDQLDLARRRHR